jgi:hypothetical protein
MNPLDIETADHQLRAGLHVSVTRPMTSRIALYGELSGDAAVLRTDSSAGPAAAMRIGIGVRLEAP